MGVKGGERVTDTKTGRPEKCLSTAQYEYSNIIVEYITLVCMAGDLTARTCTRKETLVQLWTCAQGHYFPLRFSLIYILNKANVHLLFQNKK